MFSIFDPSTFLSTSLNWLVLLIIFLVMPMAMWPVSGKMGSLMGWTSLKFYDQMKSVMGPGSTKGMMLLVMSLFVMIWTMNFAGLWPYVFGASTHLAVSLSLTLPLWASVMIYGYSNKTEHMFAHLVPLGSPAPLMPFMVVIETISSMIRPVTLAVRLSANMVAGHILMALIGTQAVSSWGVPLVIIMVVQTLLVTMELAVTFIQAYVLAMLVALYTSEIN